jgi:hypothetical protein
VLLRYTLRPPWCKKDLTAQSLALDNPKQTPAGLVGGSLLFGEDLLRVELVVASEPPRDRATLRNK